VVFALISIYLSSFLARGAELSPEQILSSLVDPVKIDQLQGKRAANSRLRKIVYWIELARRSGHDPATVIRQAQQQAGYFGTARAVADQQSLLRNRIILERLGCFDEAGMMALRKGNASTIKIGPYTGDIAAVDHIIPRSVVEELDEKLYNLEFMPSRLNSKKGNAIGLRQKQLSVTWHKLGLLSKEGYQNVADRFGRR